MLKPKHLRKISKTAFTPSAPCERTFCMQKSSYRCLPDNCQKLYYLLNASELNSCKNACQASASDENCFTYARLSLLIYLLYLLKNFPIRLYKPGKHTANSKGYSAFFVCYYVQNRSEHQSYRQKFKDQKQNHMFFH